jgi:hypothetical protein
LKFIEIAEKKKPRNFFIYHPNQALYERQSECDAAVCIVWGGRGGGVGGVPVRAYRLSAWRLLLLIFSWFLWLTLGFELIVTCLRPDSDLIF